MKDLETVVLSNLGKHVVITFKTGMTVECTLRDWYTGEQGKLEVPLILVDNSTSGASSIGSGVVADITRVKRKVDVAKPDKVSGKGMIKGFFK